MKLLLTSDGIENASIRAALEELLGKPVEQSSAVYVPTAMWATGVGVRWGWEQLRRQSALGWETFGVLELTALPSLLEEQWLPAVAAADALVVGGGNTSYLSHWMQRSGLAERLPALLASTVYVGISAGSMVATASLEIDRDRLARDGVYVDDLYDEVAPPGAGSDATVGLAGLVVRPHVGLSRYPKLTPERLAAQAAELSVPMYALDDDSALSIVDGRVEVVSEGHWTLYPPGSAAR